MLLFYNSVLDHSELDEKCHTKVLVSGSKKIAAPGYWDIGTDYTGVYLLHSFHNGKPVYRHSGPARSPGTAYPTISVGGPIATMFYLYFDVSRSTQALIS